MKERFTKFIQDFNKINIKKICEEYGINPKNVYGGNTSFVNMELIYKKLQYEIEKLMIEDKYYGINENLIEVLEEKGND